MEMAIAAASMQMAESKVAMQAQTSILKNVMDIQEQSYQQLFASMGIGQNLNIEA